MAVHDQTGSGSTSHKKWLQKVRPLGLEEKGFAGEAGIARVPGQVMGEEGVRLVLCSDRADLGPVYGSYSEPKINSK